MIMDLQLLDKILPVLSVLIGAIVGFFGNYFVGKSLFNKEVNQKKEDHLKELLNEYITVVNTLIDTIENILEETKSLHNKRIDKSLEDSFAIKHHKLLSTVESITTNIHIVESKYDFTLKLELQSEMDQFRAIAGEFLNFIDTVENSGEKIPIKNNESMFIFSLEAKLQVLKANIKSKISKYYSVRFLPHK